MMYEQLSLPNCQEQTCGLTDSPVKESALQENKKELEKVRKIPKQMNGATFSSKLQDFYRDLPKRIDPSGCSVKMLKIFCLSTEDMDSQEYSILWKKWGMTQNGNSLILSTATPLGGGATVKGVPQNRERVYIVSHLRSRGRREVFPIVRTDTENTSELQENLTNKLPLTPISFAKPFDKPMSEMWIGDFDLKDAHTLLARDYKGIANGSNGVLVDCDKTFTDLSYKQFNNTDVARCITARYTASPNSHTCESSGVLISTEASVDNDEPKIIDANNGNASKGSIIIGGKNIRIRRLTPKECWRLQGWGFRQEDGSWDDTAFEKAKASGVSDSQLYKQAGNGCSANVVMAIGLTLKEIENSFS